MDISKSSSSSSSRSPLGKMSGNEVRVSPTKRRKSQHLTATPCSETTVIHSGSPSTSTDISNQTVKSVVEEDSTNTVDSSSISAKTCTQECSEAIASTIPLDYPTDISLPSRGIVQALFEEAGDDTDQQVLTPAGVLSFQHVLLPAVGFRENQALKKWQGKIQRDIPEQKNQVVFCRKFVWDCISAACSAVERSRLQRAEKDAVREEQWAKEKVANEIAQQERHKTEAIKKHPKNQAMWREVVYLMTEISKLQKEARSLTEAKEALTQRRAEMEAAIEQQHKREPKSPVVEELGPSQELQQVQEAMEEIVLSSNRMKLALEQVNGLVSESEKVRNDLYERFRRDYQFYGYEGIHDTKGLLRSLSQSQDVPLSQPNSQGSM